jgi:hypothetical protein
LTVGGRVTMQVRWFPRRGWWISTTKHLNEDIASFFRGIWHAQLREAIAERVAGEAKGAGGLAFVAVGLAEGFADGFVFPLL